MKNSKKLAGEMTWRKKHGQSLGLTVRSTDHSITQSRSTQRKFRLISSEMPLHEPEMWNERSSPETRKSRKHINILTGRTIDFETWNLRLVTSINRKYPLSMELKSKIVLPRVKESVFEHCNHDVIKSTMWKDTHNWYVLMFIPWHLLDIPQHDIPACYATMFIKYL